MSLGRGHGCLVSNIPRRQGSIQGGGLTLTDVSGVSITAVLPSGVKQGVEEVLSDLTEAGPDAYGFSYSLP
jgi:hypothetical protein